MSKQIKKIFLIMLVSLICGGVFSGCASGAVSYHLTSLPQKIIYKIGEKVNFDGIKVETTNCDGTNTMISLNAQNFSEIDTSTSGEKEVIITKNNLSTSFNIYVADIVATDSDNLKAIFSSAENGDIIYLTKGNYVPKNNSDESYKDMIIDKSLTIVGDGKDKTLLNGNFLVGAKKENENFVAIDNFADIKIMNINFKLDYLIKDNFVSYNGAYKNTDYNGAINSFNTKNMLVTGCNFSGYAYGINAQLADGLTVKNNNFRYIFKNAINVTKNIKNSTIYKNVFMDIAANTVASDDNTQSSLGAVLLSFEKEGNAGVIVSNNTFTRIGMHDGEIVYYDAKSKTFAKDTKEQLFKLSYINNSAILTMVSSAKNGLKVSGIILSSNNYGAALSNVRLNTNSSNNVDQNGIIFNES